MVNKNDLRRVLSIGGKMFPVDVKTKRPLIKGWESSATSDTSILTKWEKQFRGCGWGIACGPSNLHVIDIDGANGELSVLDRELPETLEVQTQSGNRHLYYKGSTASRNRILPGLDIKSAGGFVVAAGSAGYSIINDVGIAPAPTWSVDLVGAPRQRTQTPKVLQEDSAGDIKRAERWLEKDAAPSIEGDGGNDNAFRVACRVKDFGISEGMCTELMLGDWNARCEPPWDFAELSTIIEHAYQYSIGDQGELSAQEDFDDLPTEDEIEEIAKKEQPPLIDRMNARHAKMPFGGKMVVWVEETNSDGSREFVPYSSMEFDKLYEHRSVPVPGADGKIKQVPVGKWWRLHRKHRRCSHIILDPKMPSGPIDQDGPFNLWRGFGIVPKKGDWADYRRIVTDALCSGNDTHAEYVLNWIALLIQKPTVLHKTAIVFRGQKGTGKSTVGLALKMILGGHAAKVDTAKAIIGRFNWHLRDKVFLLAEEVRWMQDRGGEGVLKSLITDPERSYEAKGLNIVNGANHISMMITTNDDWAIPATADERRFAVFDVDNCLVGDKDLWGRVYSDKGTLRTAPIAAMMHDLAQRDISRFDPIRHAPKTDALAEQAFESMDYLDRWWFDRLSTGQPPGMTEDNWRNGELAIPISDVYDDFSMFVPRGKHVPSKLTVGKRLSTYGVSRKRIRGDDGLQYAWTFPILSEARSVFEKVFNRELEW